MEVGVPRCVRSSYREAHSLAGPVSAGWRGGTILPPGRLPLAEGFPPTRLETRTKESNMYASRRVENP